MNNNGLYVFRRGLFNKIKLTIKKAKGRIIERKVTLHCCHQKCDLSPLALTLKMDALNIRSSTIQNILKKKNFHHLCHLVVNP